MHYRRISYRYMLRRVGAPQFGDPRSEQLPLGLAQPTWRPPADVYECADQYLVKVEIPGVAEADLEITLYEDVVVIEGTRAAALPEDGVRVLAMEVRYGPFRIDVPLPPGIDRDRVSATYEQGFLQLVLPRIGGAA